MKHGFFSLLASAAIGFLFSNTVLAETFESTTNDASTPSTTATSATNSTSTKPPITEPVQNTNAHKGLHSPDTTVSKTLSKTAPWLNNFSGNVTATTNYIFRGVSQTQNSPALQAGLTYQLPKGFYVNAWGSNVKQVNNIDTNVEIDGLLGWTGRFNQDFSYSFDIDRYSYSAHQLSYNELNTLFNYSLIQFGYSYSPNVFGTTGIGRYYFFGLNYDVPPKYSFTIENVSVHLSAGHYTLPKTAGNSYNDYSMWITKRFKQHYFVTAQWTDTNGRQKTISYADPHILVLLGADF